MATHHQQIAVVVVVTTQGLKGHKDQVACRRTTGAHQLQAVMEAPLGPQLRAQAPQILLTVSLALEVQLDPVQGMDNLQTLAVAPTLGLRQVQVAPNLQRLIHREPTQAKGMELLALPTVSQLVDNLHLSRPQDRARRPLMDLPARMTVTVPSTLSYAFPEDSTSVLV